MNLLTKAHLRRLHFRLAPIMILPLLLTVSTGMIFQFSQITGNSYQDFQWLLEVHIGNFGAVKLEKIYPLLNGLGIIFLAVTGIMIWLQTPERRKKD